jgi:ribosome biogenesis GTPase / thiamine phosphate phosphatase
MARLRHESQALDPADANGTVAEVFPKLCKVRIDASGATLLCPYRRAQVYNREAAEADIRERTPVAVGDRVKVQVLGSQDGVVEGVSSRRNQLMRLAPGREGLQIHILASNDDLLVIVAAVREPEFSPGLIDRFLVAGQIAGIETVICINKMDLRQQDESPWEIYSKIGIPVVPVSAKGAPGVQALQERIAGKLSVFCGHSGVGKTSLLRVLLGREIGRIGELSQATGKGRHTTTGAVLLEGPGCRVIDTPGIREFGVVGIEPEELRHYFPEFRELGCAVTDCLHEDEPGCVAQELPRYSSYRRVLTSLKEEYESRKPRSTKTKPGRKSLWR